MPIRVTVETRNGRLVSTRIDGEDTELVKDTLAESMADPHAHPVELGDLLIMSDNIGAAWVVVEHSDEVVSGEVLH